MGTRGAPQCWGEPAANPVDEPAHQPKVEPDDNTIYVEGAFNYSEYDSQGGADVGAHATSVTGDIPSGGPSGHGGDDARGSVNWEEQCPPASESRTTQQRHMCTRRRVHYKYHGTAQTPPSD